MWSAMSDSDKNNAGRRAIMKARISDDLAQSSRTKAGNSRAVARNLLHSLAEISATVTSYFWRQNAAADVTAENSAENAPGKADLGAIVVEEAAVTPSLTQSFSAPVTADVIIIGSEAQTNRVAHTAPDDQEVKRRRDLVRTLFNDFWTESFDKPAAFVDRLAQAEPYINERLAAFGELWQLDAETRTTLGLPSTKNRANPRQA
jgi:hypothetical protein